MAAIEKNELKQENLEELLVHLNKFDRSHSLIKLALDESEFDSIKIEEILESKKQEIQDHCNFQIKQVQKSIISNREKCEEIVRLGHQENIKTFDNV
jgi:DNA primase